MAHASDHAAGTPPRHILLVDDSEPDRLLARTALKHSGAAFQLDCLDNGRDCLRWLAERAPQPAPVLVLLDMRMPDWDGLRTLAEIRRHPDLRRTAVVFLTSLETHDPAPMYDAGVNAYVIKPGSLQGLIRFFEDLDGFWFDHITQGDVVGAEMPTA